jgi:hypothetical protein
MKYFKPKKLLAKNAFLVGEGFEKKMAELKFINRY